VTQIGVETVKMRNTVRTIFVQAHVRVWTGWGGGVRSCSGEELSPHRHLKVISWSNSPTFQLSHPSYHHNKNIHSIYIDHYKASVAKLAVQSICLSLFLFIY
jgi:hypothetical protein